MAVATVHVLRGIQTPTSFLSQIENARPSSNISILNAGSAGFPYPLFTANQGETPGITFDSTQLKTLLDLCGITIGNLTGGNTDLYWQKVAYAGQRVADATTEHTRVRAAEAFLVIDRITATHQGEGSASCRIGALWDGTNEPLVPAGSVALAGTPTSAEHYGCGPIYANGTRINAIQEVTIDFGRELILAGGDSELWPTFVAERMLAPVITFRSLDMGWNSSFLHGLNLSSLSVYLRAKVNEANYLADGSAGHIKFSGTAGLLTVDDTAAGGNSEMATTFRATLQSSSAAGAPIAVNTAIAITT